MEYSVSSIYQMSAQCLYLAALLTVLVLGLTRLLMRSERWKHFFLPQGMAIGAALGVLTLLTGVLFTLAAIMDQIESVALIVNIVVAMVLTLAAAAAIYPSACEVDQPKVPPPWGLVGWNQLMVLGGATLVWSVGSMLLAARFVEFKFPPGSYAELISRDRPIELAGFCMFALMAAIMEEIIFRGGIQGLLERTFLGPVGALWVASLLFALGHAGILLPLGIKELQTLGLGLFLGVTRMRFGLGAAIGVHLVNNLMALLLEVMGVEIG